MILGPFSNSGWIGQEEMNWGREGGLTTFGFPQRLKSLD